MEVKDLKQGKGPYIKLCMLVTGIVLISSGLAFATFLVPVYEYILRDGLTFTKNSEPFKAWKVNDPPLDLDLYLFNWTNPKELRHKGVKPRFQEIGPYRIKEVKEKADLVWNDNDTISYKVRKLYYFDPSYSPKKLDDDLITTINAVPLTVAYQAKNFNYLIKRILSISMSSLSPLYVTKTARQILFDGYPDGILNVLSRFPGLNAQDRFGMFYGINGTVQNSVFNMYTKTDENFGRLLTWNYKNHSGLYPGKCGDIKGSAMEFYPLNIKKTKLVFFSSELCKFAELSFEKEEVIKGVTGYKFMGDKIFDNGSTIPENRCFCENAECLPSGVMDVSKCRKNSPTYLSFPHFYAADPYYSNLIEGMHPQQTKHQLYIIIEPKSGIIMDIGANMQMNMLLQPLQGFLLYQDVPKIFFPMFYFTQHLELKDDLAEKLRLIQRLPNYFNYASIGLICLGLTLVVWSAYSIFSVCASDKKQVRENCYEIVPLSDKNLQNT
ncbi:protein peste-like [Euwallacea similis]|uniref:protein peste-like n=1 Tax=Euwallacea similis TaxID=1736056 RepID=UPI00344EBC92